MPRRPAFAHLAPAVLALSITLAGCSTYAAQPYSIAPANVAVLRAFRGQGVNVGPFISSSNGKSVAVSNHYAFSGNFVGEVACNQTAQALMPAVQDLISKIVRHSEFSGLLR